MAMAGGYRLSKAHCLCLVLITLYLSRQHLSLRYENGVVVWTSSWPINSDSFDRDDTSDQTPSLAHQETTKTNDKDDHHGSRRRFVVDDRSINVDLLPWEIKSIDAIRDWKTPKIMDRERCQTPTTLWGNVSTDCCLGSHSRHGHVCFGKSRLDYQRVRQIAQRHTLPLLLPSSSTNERRRRLCDVCQTIHLLYRHNLTLSFLGDSITRQSFSGFLCALQRRGYRVETESDTREPPFYVHATIHYHDPSPPPHDTTMTKGSSSSPSLLRVSFYNHYLFPKPLQEWEDLYMKPNNVLLLGYGIHWTVGHPRKRLPPTDYRAKWRETLQHWKTNRNGSPLILLRESSTQHFDADGGEFWIRNDRIINPKVARCQPHSPQQPSIHHGWRERILQDELHQQGYRILQPNEPNHQDEKHENQQEEQRRVVWIPFLNYTAELDFMHLSSIGDCTHFCSSPYIWWPLWRSVRLAMDQRFDTTP